MTVSTSPLEILTRKLEAHADLTEDDRSALLALPCVVRSVEAGSYLVHDGEHLAEHLVLVSGYAYRSRVASGGVRQILSVQIPGEALACSSLFFNKADHNTQALTRAEVAAIPRRAVQELIRNHSAIAHAVLMITLIEASILSEWLVSIGRRDAQARIAHLLCEFAYRLDAAGLSGHAGYELPMTQEQIGDALGLTSVHVNRTLRALREVGVIEREGKSLRFPSWEKLRSIGDFSPEYLHLGTG